MVTKETTLFCRVILCDADKIFLAEVKLNLFEVSSCKRGGAKSYCENKCFFFT